MLLTIAIPTFNRLERTVTTLNAILNEDIIDVEILVIDNASRESVERYARRHISHLPENVHFHRNIANVGLAGNICKCYELARSQWVWTLGDDDHLVPKAVTIIKRTLANFRDDDAIRSVNFSTSLFTYPKQIEVHDLKNFWQVTSEPAAFSNALFLSSCVYRVDMAHTYLRFAYEQVFSAAPHIALVMHAVEDGRKHVFCRDIIAKHQSPTAEEAWNQVTVFSRIPLLAETCCEAVSFRGIAPALIRFAPGLSLKSGLGLLMGQDARSLEFWLRYYDRLLPFLHGRNWVSCMLLRCLASCFMVFPKLYEGLRQLPMVRRKVLGRGYGSDSRL